MTTDQIRRTIPNNIKKATQDELKLKSRNYLLSIVKSENAIKALAVNDCESNQNPEENSGICLE